MAKYVGLMRGINVGGKHKLPMATLRAVFERAGASAVQTYIQSGNIVFEAPAKRSRAIADDVSAAIEADLGFSAPVVLRSAAAWAKLIETNPFSEEAAADPKRVHVMLLDRAPSKAARASFEPDCRLAERWVLAKDAVFVDYPGGSARSKVGVSYVDRVLGCTATARNWRTIEALDERVRGD